MRLEDVKPGMWVRHDAAGTVGQVVAGKERWIVAFLDGSAMTTKGLPDFEPWVPRVGEWVRNLSDTIAPVVGIRHATENCEAVATLGHPSGCTWCVKDLEPCAPPDAKPAQRVRAEATLEIDVVAYDPAKTLDFIAAHQLRELSVAYGGPVEVQMPPPDHNATCPKCGGRAYQGLLNAQCVEPVCDDPETREPDAVSESMRYPNARCEMFNAYGERVYEAVGRGRVETHPTREGAIAAWRKAVRK